MLEGFKIIKLKQFFLEEGNLFHGLKNSDDGYDKFGEIYFSFINKNSIKAWKFHKKMTLNLIVPVGSIRFNFLDFREESSTFKEKFTLTLSDKDYSRLTVPPKIWFGFKGLGDKTNLLVNIANMPHDDNEVETKDIDKFEFI
tara:strand:+ start:15 stop:440 length:426 start_codon:yes stop_codon:yes gene_type:complete